MPVIDQNTQIRADGLRYTIPTGPSVNPTPANGDGIVFNSTTGVWEYDEVVLA